MISTFQEFVKKNGAVLFSTTDTQFPNSIVCLHNPDYIYQVENNNNIICVVTTEEIAQKFKSKAELVLTEDPISFFYSAYISFYNKNKVFIPSSISKNAHVSKNAIIARNNVIIEDDVIIDDGVIIKSGVVIKSGSTIRSGAVIGGEGLEIKKIYGKRTLIPHDGKVIINENVDIGYNTCIDKGLYGQDTIISENVFVDNLCHIAHGVFVGKNCTITASVEISGSVSIGDNVWLAPNSCISHKVKIGSNSFIGIGAVVTKDVADNVLAAGNPAKKLRII